MMMITELVRKGKNKKMKVDQEREREREKRDGDDNSNLPSLSWKYHFQSVWEKLKET